MKNNLLYALPAIVAAVCCTSIEVEKPVATVHKTFSADLEGTRGYISNYMYATWKKGETVAVYDDKDPDTKHTFTVTVVNGNKVTIEGEVSENSESYKAVYPADAAIANQDGEGLKLSITGYQWIPDGGNIDPRVMVSVASASEGESFVFHNVISLVKFTVSRDDVKTIWLSNCRKGTGYVKASNAELTAVPTDSRVRLYYGNEKGGVYFPKGDYYAAVYPGTIPSTSVVCSTGSLSFWKHKDSGLTFERSSGINLGTVDNGNQLLAKWRFTKKYSSSYTDTSLKYYWAQNVSAKGYGNSELYTNDGGNGRIKFYHSKADTLKKSVYKTNNYYWPEVGNKIAKNDYWIFRVISAQTIAAGSKIHARFLSNCSGEGPKYWQILVNDGNGCTAVPDEGYISDSLVTDYTTTLAKTGSTTVVDVNWTLSADIAGSTKVTDLIKFKCVSDICYDGSTGGAGYCRLCDGLDSEVDAGPYIEIVQ